MWRASATGLARVGPRIAVAGRLKYPATPSMIASGEGGAEAAGGVRAFSAWEARSMVMGEWVRLA